MSRDKNGEALRSKERRHELLRCGFVPQPSYDSRVGGYTKKLVEVSGVPSVRDATFGGSNQSGADRGIASPDRRHRPAQLVSTAKH